MTSVQFKTKFLHLDVLAVAHHRDYVLAGIGSDLFVYLNRSLILSKSIFLGERIHNINIKGDLALIKGGRQLSLVKLKESASNELECETILKIQSSDWIQDVIPLENEIVGLVTAHNAFEYWDSQLGKQLGVNSSEENCILYSCKIIGSCLEDVVVFAGTVFGVVFIWTPSLKENPILKRLKSHKGAVFSIQVQPKDHLLATTSDDRSLKIWSFVSPCSTPRHPEFWKTSSAQLVHTLFGHTARVWKSLILPDYYLTIGEDSNLIVWSRDGRMIRSVSLHQESGIRALTYSDETDLIITGGEDGGINAFSLRHLTDQNPPLEALSLTGNLSTKVCFTKTGFVYTLSGKCFMVTNEGEEVLYKNENFSSYCILEVSEGDDYVIMGSIKGHLVILDTNTRTVLVEEQILNGRIYSIHWLGLLLVTCGPEGRLDLWEFSNGVLRNVGRKTLPSCKERWTTCGGVCNEKLILGDRMGNLHVYGTRNGGENPVKTFRKIHSYLGVTDLFLSEDGFRSVGRDGTVKEFTGDFDHSKTFKLPMEWPWKIVEYENDILILGFHSVLFVVWSMNKCEIIASHDCRGGHRSCDFRIEKNKLRFLYVKGKKVFFVDLVLDGIVRVRSGFHGKEINCLKILQSEPTVVVTGGEDTTLRVSAIRESEVHSVEVLKTHISSIRDVCACPTDTKLVVVSVGGKGQIVLWDFDLKTLKCREMVNRRLRKETGNWKSPVVIIDPETRIMSVSILKLQNELLIATGCSDCHVRIFTYKENLSQVCEIQCTHCVLNVKFSEVGMMRVLLTAGTNGRVVFWDVTDCSHVKQLGKLSLHQSGVNSLAFEKIDGGKFILATGGDDNLISLAIVEISGSEVDLKRVWKNGTTHSCQITGIKILKSFLLTTSIDQRITIWKWSWDENELNAKFLNQYITAVPDIQGMDTAWLENSLLVAVHGKGMEILEMDVNSYS